MCVFFHFVFFSTTITIKMITYEELEEAWEKSGIELHPKQSTIDCSNVVGIALSSVGIISIMYFVIFEYLI